MGLEPREVGEAAAAAAFRGDILLAEEGLEVPPTGTSRWDVAHHFKAPEMFLPGTGLGWRAYARCRINGDRGIHVVRITALRWLGACFVR